MKNIKCVFVYFFLLTSSFAFGMEQEGENTGNCTDLGLELIDGARNKNFDYVKKVIKKIENYSNVSDYKDFTKECMNYQGLNGDTPLLAAISNLTRGFGDTKKIIKLLLKKSADINMKSANGFRILLIQAATRNDFSDNTIRLLIKYGADIEIRNIRGSTTFMILLAWGKLTRAKLFIDLGADINARDYEGDTALSRIANLLTEKRIKFLLEHGADFYIKNNKGQTALDRAQDKNIIKLLEDAQKENKSLIRKLIRRINRGSENSKNKIKLLLAAHPKLVNCEGNNALHIAAQLRNKKMFKFILGGCPELLKKNNHAGLTPIEENPEMLVFLILDLKEDQDKNGFIN